ncbi:MAG: protein kinase [Sandaracinaceae bacterium]
MSPTLSALAMAAQHDISDSNPDPLVGRVLDERYRIVGVIGRGGMGIVYEARHAILGGKLAIKLLRAEAWGDDEALARLKREAQTTSAIGHPNIVDVRDFGRLKDGSTYVVMELIEGDDLLRTVRRAGRLPWTRARDIALQICAALGAAHEAGVVHRDLKPENILLTVKGGKPDFVKIVDFGIAMVQGAAKITQAGRVVGTPEYMSPEQCAGIEVDGRADIYALGVLLYEMTTGRLPFASDDLVQLVRMHMQEPPVPPSHLEPALPLGFEAIVLRCLAKRPAKRFATMAEVADALRAIEAAPIEAPPREDLEEAEPMLRAARSTPPASPTPASMAPPRSTSGIRGSLQETPSVVTLPPGSSGGSTVRRAVLLGLGLLAAIGGGSVGYLLMTAPDPAALGAEVPIDRADPSDAPTATPPLTAPATEAPTRGEADPPTAPASQARVHIDSSPERAQVIDAADGAMLGNTPFDIERPTGEDHTTLIVRQPEYDDVTIVLSARSQDTLHVTLHRVAQHGSRRGDDSVATPDATSQDTSPPPSSARRGRQGQAPHHRPYLDPWASPPRE